MLETRAGLPSNNSRTVKTSSEGNSKSPEPRKHNQASKSTSQIKTVKERPESKNKVNVTRRNNRTPIANSNMKKSDVEDGGLGLFKHPNTTFKRNPKDMEVTKNYTPTRGKEESTHKMSSKLKEGNKGKNISSLSLNKAQERTKLAPNEADGHLSMKSEIKSSHLNCNHKGIVGVIFIRDQ